MVIVVTTILIQVAINRNLLNTRHLKIDHVLKKEGGHLNFIEIVLFAALILVKIGLETITGNLNIMMNHASPL